MTWKEHYEELNPKDYSFKSDSKTNFIITAIFLNILLYALYWELLVISCSWEIYISFFIFSFISISFPMFIFKILLLSPHIIKVFYNKNNNLLLEFSQKKYLDEKINTQKSKEKIFFVTWLGKKEEDTKLKRAIYLYANYKYKQYLKKYDIDNYATTYLTTIFISTAISFWGLILILTIDSTNINPNYIFLFSIVYILYIILTSYASYSEKEQDIFFKKNLRGFPENYFLLDSNLDIDKKEKQKSFDVFVIVFGVLFTLYLTLAYNSIYTVGVDIKKVSNNSKLTHETSIKTECIHKKISGEK